MWTPRVGMTAIHCADNGNYIEQVCSKYQLHSEFIVGDESYHMKGLFTGTAPLTDEPFIAMLDYFCKYNLNKKGSERGIKSMLSGEFGDIVFQGNNLFMTDKFPSSTVNRHFWAYRKSRIP
jgi:asparagine synthetase B (glutamine-hydrolysing)